MIRPSLTLFRTALSIAIDRSHTFNTTVHHSQSHSHSQNRYKVEAAIYLMEHDANVADTVKVLDGLDNRYIRS
jgi:hypothetical protein